ncbi:Potassium transporter 5 [Asimina triloba]
MNRSAYTLQPPNKHSKSAQRIKEAMERSSFAKACLLCVALFGTCMVIGDGILTPCISVLSAVGGVRKIDEHLSKDVVVMISVAILVILFSIQRFGTDKGLDLSWWSATFAIIKQSMALGCFPRVQVLHTSHKHEGQVYIPEIIFILMFACVLFTAAFKETSNIGNAYGIAVVAVEADS